LQRTKHILLAGSSHTSLVFPYVKRALNGKAVVSKLPDYAGNTEEILETLPGWPLEDQDGVHVYAGHRDLMLDGAGYPVVGPERFRDNLETVMETIISRTPAKILLSNIPPVEEHLLALDAGRNQRIALYNHIIEDVAGKTGVTPHDFSGFVLAHGSGAEKYSDGLHFTRKFYQEFAGYLAASLVRLLA
jgi:lysophospholipase L1-like esterase